MPNKKVGRNESCPCGSGKKFKHCCDPNENSMRSTKLMNLRDTSSMTVKILGLPAQPQDLHIINRFREPDIRNTAPLGGSEGDYSIIFTLLRPGYNLLPENRFSFAKGLR